MRYFIVDDSLIDRMMMQKVIEQGHLGEVVGDAKDGSEVKEDLLQVERVDVVLLDMVMRKEPSLQILSKLKASTYEGAIVMVSGMSDQNIRSEALLRGAEYYIEKPINASEMITTLQKVEDHLRIKRTLLETKQKLAQIKEKQNRAKQWVHQNLPEDIEK